jgi:hypothetical protein
VELVVLVMVELLQMALGLALQLIQVQAVEAIETQADQAVLEAPVSLSSATQYKPKQPAEPSPTQMVM